MSAELALVGLIQSPDARAVALIGGWGRGKTHMWRQLIGTTPGKARSKYSYVSLFGANSVDDLKLAIFQKEIDAGPPPQEPNAWSNFKRKFNWRDVANSASQLDNPWVGNLGGLYRTVSFLRVKDQLICFDDFERRGRDLDLEQVLGLITYLCEERNCSVVLILNDATMEGIADWNKHREKVFHAEVSYRPTTEACIDIIFGKCGSDEWFDSARNVLLQLDVSNMRIMSRIKDAIAPLAERYRSASVETKSRISASLTLYSYCHNASGEGAPPVQRALRNSYERLATIANDAVRSEEEQRWDEILSKVDFYPDALDVVVVAYVEDGYMDVAAFDSQVQRLEAALQVDSAERAFSAAWHAYHDTFEDNADQVASMFQLAFPAAASGMHAMNANSTIALMRRLGQEELADCFISQWIEPRRGARRHELSLQEAQIFGPLTDERFIEALNQAEREEACVPDLAEAMFTLAKGQGGLDQALLAVSMADTDAIAQWLKQNAGQLSRSFTLTSMRYRGGAHVEVAQALIKEALANLARQSSINAIRVDGILKSINAG